MGGILVPQRHKSRIESEGNSLLRRLTNKKTLYIGSVSLLTLILCFVVTQALISKPTKVLTTHLLSNTSPSTTDTAISDSKSNQANSPKSISSITPTNVGQSNSSSSTNITVNGQPVAVSASGTTDQTIQSDGSTTTVKVNQQNSSSGSSNNHSLNVNVSSNSQNTSSSSEDSN